MKAKLSPRAFTRFWDLHAWTGVVAGLVLYVMFVAGAITLFHAPLETWEEPLTQCPPAAETLDQSLARVLAAQGSTPEDLWFYPPREGRGEPCFSHHDGAAWRTACLDSRTGHLVPEREHLAHFLYRLHFLWHDLTGRALYYVAGLLSVGLLLALVTGVLIHLKDLVRQLHRFRPDGSRRVLWSDMHKVLGVMGLPFQLMYAYTGAFLVLGPVVLGVFTGPVFGGDEKLAAALAWGTAELDTPAAALPSPGLPLEELTRRARIERPDLEPAYYHLLGHGRAGAAVEIIGLGGGSPRPGVTVRLRASDGEVLRTPADAAGPAAEARRWLRGLHLASFGGLHLRFLFFVLALAGCAAILTGNWVWLSRRPETRGNNILARLTAGVGAGTWVATAALFVASRALPLDWPLRGGAEELTFLAALAACITWALLAPDRRSLWQKQLALAAALFLPVPLLAARVSEAGLFGAGPKLAPVVGVDAGLLVTSLALGATAWLLHRASRATAPLPPPAADPADPEDPEIALPHPHEPSPEVAFPHASEPAGREVALSRTGELASPDIALARARKPPPREIALAPTGGTDV